MIICWAGKVVSWGAAAKFCDWIEMSDTERLSALLPKLVEDESYFRNLDVYADNRADPSERARWDEDIGATGR